ncbi:hypothetical protein EVAR_98007_1 [Eumeta japonica]|uniref:Uncharacterized protein n=1 Tax=Eumeta variegata TaxID=151549 RepID=A0A4C1WJI8_EUMVA|nr:hypothetical protein EVAR_98007_1 [Eumeta japonica]
MDFMLNLVKAILVECTSCGPGCCYSADGNEWQQGSSAQWIDLKGWKLKLLRTKRRECGGYGDNDTATNYERELLASDALFRLVSESSGGPFSFHHRVLLSISTLLPPLVQYHSIIIICPLLIQEAGNAQVTPLDLRMFKVGVTVYSLMDCLLIYL